MVAAISSATEVDAASGARHIEAGARTTVGEPAIGGPAFDAELVAKRKADYGVDIYYQILPSFRNDAWAQLQAAQAQLTGDGSVLDEQSLRRAMHTLKSVSNTVGATVLATLAARGEVCALSEYPQLLARLSTEVERACAVIDAGL